MTAPYGSPQWQMYTADFLRNTSANPVTNDGAALGSSSLQWSDLFLAEGGVINWDNGDATLTQSGNTLTLGGASYIVAAGNHVGVGTSSPTVALGDTGNDTTLTVLGASGSGYGILKLLQGGTGNNREFGRITFGSPDYSGSEKRTSVIRSLSTTAATDNPSGKMELYTSNAGTLGLAVTVHPSGGVSVGNTTDPGVGSLNVGTSLIPDANDGAALGTTSLQWSDLFLAEGGVINWDNGDATLTQSGNTVTLAGAALSLGEGQLVFPATQNASSDANTLDDYEEGTWTPAIAAVTTGDLTVAYSSQVGTYTKIGRDVRASFQLITSTFTHTTAANGVSITGFPFTFANNGANMMGALTWSGITKAGYTDINAAGNPNTTTARLFASASATAFAVLSITDLPTGGTVVLISTVNYNI